MIMLARISKLATAALFLAITVVIAPVAIAQQSPVYPGPVPNGDTVISGVLGETAPATEGEAEASEAPEAESSTTKPPVTIRSGVTAITGNKQPPAVTGKTGPYDPIQQRSVDFGEVPVDGKPISMSFLQTGTPAAEFLDTVAESTGWNILPTPEAAKTELNFSVKELTPAQALEVLQFHGLFYEFDPDTKFLYVMTRDQYLQREYGRPETREFEVRYADINDMTASLGTLLSESGRMIPDPRTGRLIVTDTSDNIAVIADALDRLDVPLKPHTFYLKHIDAATVVESVQALLTERGVAFSDPRMNVLSVTDMPSRIAQIETLVAALDIPQESHTWTLNYASAKDIAKRLEPMVPEEMGIISKDDDVHQVTVTAIPERIRQIDELIMQWDVPRKQVQIEVYLVLANTEIERNFGIDWSYFDEWNGDPIAIRSGGNSPDFTKVPDSGQLVTVGTLPIPIYDYNPLTGNINTDINGDNVIDGFRGNSVSVVLEYLDQQGDASILSRPRVTVQDGEKAIFQNTEERPYQEGGYSQYGGIANDPDFNPLIPLTVRFIEVGTILKVMPRINDDGKVLMEIDVEDSTAEDVTVTTADQESTIPLKTKANAKTSVLVQDTQTIVIGGLRNVSTDDSVEKVPFLGDVPFVGRLFKSTEKKNRHRELLVFITPTIVDPFTSKEADRLANFDHNIEEKLRTDKKNIFKRNLDKFTKKENEIVVSIGQSGDMMIDGMTASIDAARARIETENNPETMTVVILNHPLAPENIAEEIATTAEGKGMKVKREQQAFPFVPSFKRQDGKAETRQE